MAASPQSLAAFVAVALLFAPASAGWSKASATFYGSADGSGTTACAGGACGYGNLHNLGYGTTTTTLSSALFNNGVSCGQCFQIRCDHESSPKPCRQGASVVVTATDLCPPGSIDDPGGKCNQPLANHFEMARPSWVQIGIDEADAGIIPVQYQLAPCLKQGGVRFTITGFDAFPLTLVTNVAGSGSVQGMWVSSTATGQVAMTRNWGAVWQCFAQLTGQALTFGVTTTGGQTVVFRNVVPADWRLGQSFMTNLQFSY